MLSLFAGSQLTKIFNIEKMVCANRNMLRPSNRQPKKAYATVLSSSRAPPTFTPSVTHFAHGTAMALLWQCHCTVTALPWHCQHTDMLTVVGAILKGCPDSGLPDSGLGTWMPTYMDHVIKVHIIEYYGRFSMDSDVF